MPLNKTEQDVTVDEYVNLIPEDSREIELKLNDLDHEIMTNVVGERMFPKIRVEQVLMLATSYYSFFTSRFSKWSAILENREVEEYVKLKAQTLALGDKFVSASAEREASNSVKSVRYLMEYYRGNQLRAEQYVNTLKKIFDGLCGEEAASRH